VLTVETIMTVALPRDIVKRLERRWTARATQSETFHAKAERLKQNATPVPEGAQPPEEEAERTNWEELPVQT
jgi:hypothetical protein